MTYLPKPSPTTIPAAGPLSNADTFQVSQDGKTYVMATLPALKAFAVAATGSTGGTGSTGATAAPRPPSPHRAPHYHHDRHDLRCQPECFCAGAVATGGRALGSR